MMATKPNFFIIGAPKCGTTALSEYLKDNPQVYFCEPKEPHYFNDDFLDRGITKESDYLSLFENIKPHHKAIGEGSVMYLYSETAVKNILEFNSDAKFIVMLRNPLEVAYSWHSQTLISHGEDTIDFKEAWDLRKIRREGKWLPPNKKERKVFIYSDVAKFGEQLERLNSLTNNKNVKVIFFEDFSSNTLKTYKEILKFLNVDYDGKTEFPAINKSKKYRFLLLEKLRTFIIDFKERHNIKIRTGLLAFLRKQNIKVSPRKKLSPEFKNVLARYYTDDISKIETITKKDLSHWKK